MVRSRTGWPDAKLDDVQAASQVTQVVCEQKTSRKQIFCLNNKQLYQTARIHENRTGKEVTCRDHPGECSSNLAADASVGKSNAC